MNYRRKHRFGFPVFLLALGVAAAVIYGIRWHRTEVAMIVVPEGASADVKNISPPVMAHKAKYEPAPTDSIELDEPEPPKIVAANRPSWVDTKPGFEDGVYRTVIVVGPYETRQECNDHLGSQIAIAAEEYIDRVLGSNASRHVALPAEFLRSKAVLDEQWEEPIWSPRNKRQMVQVHALLEFDKVARNELDRRWHAAQVHDRLWYTAGGAAGILALVGTLFGYLRLNPKNES